MAVSTVAVRKTVPGDAIRTTTKITGDASYPTGGYLLTPQALGFTSQILDVISIDASNLAAGAFVPIITATYAADGFTIISLQFQLEQYAVAAEVANATNVSAASYRLIVEGR